MRRLLLALSAIGGMLIMACTDAATSPTPAGVLVEVPTQSPVWDRPSCMTALLSGTLVADRSLGIAVRTPDGDVVKVRWPNGFVGRERDGAVELLDANGTVVGRAGDHVELGGGYLPDADDGEGEAFNACPDGLTSGGPG